jgi:antitoxin ParD1/3/4
MVLAEVAVSKVQKRTISLPSEQAEFIDEKVAAGDYASVSEVVRAGLRALKERDAAVERWLRDEVAPTYDAMARDTGRGLSIDAVFADVRAHHEERSRNRK